MSVRRTRSLGRWARRGTRPSAPKDQRTKSAYIFGVICPERGKGTGLVLPVAEIVALARARGVDVIVDSAHAWGQLDFRMPALGADFVGLNGHKWIGAPIGVGVLYIRKDRIGDVDPFMASEEFKADDVLARVHTGTMSYAAVLALGDAVDLHQRITAGA